MAAQINYSDGDLPNLTVTVNIIYVDAGDASITLWLIRKEGATMPTTGGGFNTSPSS